MLEALLLPSIALLVGLVILVWSADIFIDSAASTAIHLNISPLIIGVVVLGFGTSLPEIIVSVFASLEGNPGLAVGNVVGSNIANVGLVLGATAILAPIIVKSSLLKRELPVVMGISIIGLLLILDSHLGLMDGIILLTLLVMVMYWMIKINRNMDPTDSLAQETEEEITDVPSMSLKKSLILLTVGLVLLMGSARLMVWGAIDIAYIFEVPDVVIGLTIVAVGTSLPELAAAIAAIKKGQSDLLIGNIIGSNLFNILAVLAVPAILAPSIIDSNVVHIDYPVLLGFTLALILLAIPRKGKAVIHRKAGILLLASFIGYLVLVYFRTVA